MTSRRDLVRPAIAVVIGALGLVAALVVRPGDASLAAEAYVLFLGALGVALLARATSRSFAAPTTSQLELALRRPQRQTQRVPELVRLEREIEMATESAFDVHYRLHPLFREIAASRLGRSAVELDAEGGRAAELLGPDAWAFVRPDTVRPADHHAPGARLDEIERAVEALEALGR